MQYDNQIITEKHNKRHVQNHERLDNQRDGNWGMRKSNLMSFSLSRQTSVACMHTKCRMLQNVRRLIVEQITNINTLRGRLFLRDTEKKVVICKHGNERRAQ